MFLYFPVEPSSRISSLLFYERSILKGHDDKPEDGCINLTLCLAVWDTRIRPPLLYPHSQCNAQAPQWMSTTLPYFFQPRMSRLQHNGGGLQLQHHNSATNRQQRGIHTGINGHRIGNPGSGDSSGESIPLTRSPVKSKPCRNYPQRPDPDMEVSATQASTTGPSPSVTNPKDAFSTLGQPISHTTLKEM